MIYNILDYGAVEGGTVNSQKMIQAAIDACAGTGGRVVIPAGNFLSGTIRLRSDMELYLEAGSTLTVSLNPADIIDFSEKSDKDNTMDGIKDGCFIYACHEKNLTISGEGKIDGKGRDAYYDAGLDGDFHECPLSVKEFRPRTTYLEDVENLTVKGITFYDASFWTLHMAGCKNVLVEGIRILNNDRGPNNDGIDPDACQNVVIRGCIVESGDDSIVLKATKPIWKKYGNCENIVISDCILHSRDSALKMGTETYGDIRNVIFSNCVVKDCSRAVGIWVRDGGTIEDIMIHHITGSTKRYADAPGGRGVPRWWGKGEPFFLSSTYRNEEKRYPGKIRRITFEQVRLTSESCIFMGGEADAVIEDIQIKDCQVAWKKQSIHTPGVFDEQPSPRDVYEHEIPWLYARHVEGLKVSGSFKVDGSMKEHVKCEEILENCRDTETISAAKVYD